MEHFLIDGSYAKLLAACRIDAAEVLRRAQLPGDLLARKAIRLTEAEYYRFLAAIGESSEEKDLAVRMATSEQIKTFSPPIFAAYCSKDGRTCIARLAAYKRLIGPMRYAIEETADACTVTLRPGDAALTIPAFLAEAEAAFLIALLRAATKEPLRPLRLTLATPPQSPALAELAGIPVSHAAENSITFAERDLARPFLSHDDAMWSYFEPELTRRRARRKRPRRAPARRRSHHRGRRGETRPLAAHAPAQAQRGADHVPETAQPHARDARPPLPLPYGLHRRRHRLPARLPGDELLPARLRPLDGRDARRLPQARPQRLGKR